jgi:hypothetical protein
VSFTIKNIDAREKLKREIEPLLARNRNKQTSNPLENKVAAVNDSRPNSEER